MAVPGSNYFIFSLNQPLNIFCPTLSLLSLCLNGTMMLILHLQQVKRFYLTLEISQGLQDGLEPHFVQPFMVIVQFF